MLQSIRDRFTGVIALAIVVVIGVALTITLVDTDTFTGGTNFAARVNGEEIPLTDFRQVVQQQTLQQEEVSRSELTPAARQAIERNVLEGMVRNRVVAQYVKAAGFRVSDQRVAEYIRSLPNFQVGGQFSNDGYLAMLASQGVSPAAFEEERRAALQIEELQAGILESSFFTPAEFRRFVILEGERRRAAFALLDATSRVAAMQITEDDLRSYYDANPGRFETEESVALDYVELRLADVPVPAEIGEEELRALYDANAERFSSAEQRRARHILIAIDANTDEATARRQAEQVRNRILAGEEFAALAREYSDDPGSASSGGDLGWASRGTYVGAFEDVLFEQNPGDVSAPVKTEFGYHIIELLEVRQGARRSFEEVRDELANEARVRAAREQFYALTERMDDAALESPGNLQAVAAAAGQPVRRVEYFTRAGGGPFGASRAVIEAAFSSAVLESGENSALIEVEDDVAVVLRVAEHRPVKLRPFDEVRTELEQAVRDERSAMLAAEIGRKIIDEARAGADLAALVTAQKSMLRSPPPLARNTEDVPAELLAAIFRAPRPQEGQPVFDGVSLPGGVFGVFRIDEVIPGRPEDIGREQRDLRKVVLARQAGVAELSALAVDLRNKAKVIVAPGLFDQQDAL